MAVTASIFLSQNVKDCVIKVFYFPYKKCGFGECMATNDPRMHDECEHSLKVSANVTRVFAKKIALGN